MAGASAGLPAGVRLSDHISLGVIARAFPPDQVRRVLSETGRASEREPLCCTDQGCGRTDPYPVLGHAMRTYFGRPSSSMRFRTWTATSISVARRSSVRERSPSPITRLNRPMVASARARAL